MFAPAHLVSHFIDDGSFDNVDPEVKVKLDHVEFKGLCLPEAHLPFNEEDPMTLEEDTGREDCFIDSHEASAGLVDFAFATGAGWGSGMGLVATDNIDVLPNEVFVLIFSYLSPQQLMTVAATCHRWRVLADEEALWRQEVERSCHSQNQARALLKLYAPLLTSINKEADRERATGLPRWKSIWLAQRMTKGNWRKGAFRRRLLPKQHSAAIFCLAFDEEYIVSGSSDHHIHVWDTAASTPLHSMVGHQYAVWNLKLAGHIAISASYDSTVRLWNVKTGKSLHTLRGHASAIWGLDTLGGKVVSSSTDTYIRLWDMETAQCERRLAGGQDTVWCSQFLDQNTIITGGSDIKVWDLRLNGEDTPVAQFSGHKDAIRCLQADSNLVVSGSYDSTAGVYDRVAGKRLWELNGHTDSITALQYNASGMLITSSFDQSFRVWDIASGSQISSWGKADEEEGRFVVEWSDPKENAGNAEDKGGKVYAMQFDDYRLITGREDGRLRIDDFTVRSLH